MARILIVTTQFPGLTSHGGISRPTYTLAKMLIGLHHSITVAVGRTELPVTAKLRSSFSDEGIRLIQIKNTGIAVTPWWLEFQFNVTKIVEENGPFDLIISQEWQAPLALCIRNNFLKVPIITWCHGGSIYENLGNNFLEQDPIKILENSLEQKQIEYSAKVVAPSKYIFSLYESFGIDLPNPTVIPLFFPEKMPVNIGSSKYPCIAFVGGLSNRKGFDIFIDYAQRLLELQPNLEVRVYGRELDFNRKDLKVLKEYKVANIEFYDDKNTEEIWEELGARNTTLICPSRIDNSPGVIYEALANGCKVLVSETQGGFELLKYAETSLKQLGDLNLGEMIEFISSEPQVKLDIEEINNQIAVSWDSLIRELTKQKLDSVPEGMNGFKVSVIIATKDRVNFLRSAITSLFIQQDFVGELIIVDDGSKDNQEVSILLEEMQLPFKSLLVQNSKSLGPGLSRNIGVSHATHEFVCFLDDDNLMYPNHLMTLTSLSERENLDAVTTYLAQAFSEKPLALTDKLVHAQIAVFCGNLFGNLNTVINLASDTHLLIKKSVFESIGGFNAIPGTSQEDWGLALKIIASGFRFESTCKPTVLYRLNSDGVQAQGHGLKHNIPIHEGTMKLFSDGNTITDLARLALSQPLRNHHPKLRKNINYGIRLIKVGHFSVLFRGILNKIKTGRFRISHRFQRSIFQGPMFFRYIFVLTSLVAKGKFSVAANSTQSLIRRKFFKK